MYGDGVDDFCAIQWIHCATKYMDIVAGTTSAQHGPLCQVTSCRGSNASRRAIQTFRNYGLELRFVWNPPAGPQHMALAPRPRQRSVHRVQAVAAMHSRRLPLRRRGSPSPCMVVVVLLPRNETDLALVLVDTLSLRPQVMCQWTEGREGGLTRGGGFTTRLSH